jgi:hypothetical protein
VAGRVGVVPLGVATSLIEAESAQTPPDRPNGAERPLRPVNDTASVAFDGGRELPDEDSNLKPSG